MNPEFHHYDLQLIQPSFESSLTDLVIELEHLRNKILIGTTRPFMFFQIRRIFHLLESLGSARIEGNNTTIAEIVESEIEAPASKKPDILEIKNIQSAMAFIDEQIENTKIDHAFIRQLHQLVVQELPTPPSGEGDRSPGQYRTWSVQIREAKHKPPETEAQIMSYMDELIAFINSDSSPKYDLIRTALAHHRFMWVHPFGNGNGRTGRLLTYAMLLKQGFNLKGGRLVNPTAIFCLNRASYNEMLSVADSGEAAKQSLWCEFVLKGLKDEIEKIDRLLDYKFFRDEIVFPSLRVSLGKQWITETEEAILKWTMGNIGNMGNKSQTIVNGDIKKHILKSKSPQQISNIIRNLVDKKMLMPLENSPRRYYLRFDNNYLLRAVIDILGEKGFLPIE